MDTEEFTDITCLLEGEQERGRPGWGDQQSDSKVQRERERERERERVCVKYRNVMQTWNNLLSLYCTSHLTQLFMLQLESAIVQSYYY